MSNSNHLQLLHKGAKAWNEWRRENPDIRPDLSMVDLRQVNLSPPDAPDTSGKSIKGLSSYRDNAYNCTGAKFRFAKLCSANLTAALFDDADLYGAD